jgi:hypothetical protein
VPYRNYAQETTDSTIYKIFGCYYEEQVKILVEILLNDFDIDTNETFTTTSTDSDPDGSATVKADPSFE